MMSGMQSLRLGDAKDDSPQTRTLLDLYEKDALVMVKYFSQVTSLFDNLIASQQHSTDALRQLSQKLIEFEKWGQSFPLGRDDSILVLTLQQFGVSLEKMSVMHEVLGRELAKHVKPLQEFSKTEHANITNYQQVCQQAEDVHEQALSKYSRLSKKKEYETKACIDSTEELHKARRKTLKSTMERYTNLNLLQYKRTINLLEPFIGAFQAFKDFQSTGSSIHSKDFHEYTGDIAASVIGVRAEMAKYMDKASTEMVDLEQNSHYYFIPEPTPDMQLKPKPVNKKLNQKGGYLWMRCKSGLSHRWERKYFFTQGCNLMSQGKGEIAGSLIVDLVRCIIQPADIDDRRFVFQLNDTIDIKKVIILQAISGSEMEEWIYTIRNINTGYSTESSQSQKLSPSLMPKLPYNDQQQNKTTMPPPAHRHQPPPLKLEKPQRGKTDSQKGKGVPPAVPPTPPPSPLDSFLLDTPIQFDMISPMDEPTMQVSLPGTVKESDGQLGPPKRINPFSQSSSQIRDDQLKASIPGFIQMFTVRFLGSMQVKTDKGSEVIMNTIRNIMTARAIHNIFKTTESNFIITSQDIRLQDLSSQKMKSIIPLQDISFWSAHHENKRWFAFISHAKNEGGAQPSYTCQVFETDTLAEEICKSLSMAAEIAYKAAILRNSGNKQGSQNNNRRASDPSHSGISNMNPPTRQTRGFSSTSSPPSSADYGPYTLPREYPQTKTTSSNGQPSQGPPGGFQAAYLHQTVPHGEGQPPTHDTGLSLGKAPLPQGMGLLPGEKRKVEGQTAPLVQSEMKPTADPSVDPKVLPVASLSLQPGQPSTQ
ncbi:DCC-interacting protein 13-alpha-like isoform X2 [Apostichopus japonicus]|uniref:DCC-interacting protein 13-alpha-like isoform X2 n=1 Tax=Stichopus japonicus TaxID=307972 RepID=UPI003AB5C990